LLLGSGGAGFTGITVALMGATILGHYFRQCVVQRFSSGG
jgi:ABC-type uncharacterized transport system permease subunit